MQGKREKDFFKSTSIYLKSGHFISTMANEDSSRPGLFSSGRVYLGDSEEKCSAMIHMVAAGSTGPACLMQFLFFSFLFYAFS